MLVRNAIRFPPFGILHFNLNNFTPTQQKNRRNGYDDHTPQKSILTHYDASPFVDARTLIVGAVFPCAQSAFCSLFVQPMCHSKCFPTAEAVGQRPAP